MKKKIGIILLAFSLVLAYSTSNAQIRSYTQSGIQQGQYIDIGGINQTPSDSLQVSDTIAYLIPITHTNVITPYMSWYWNQIGAGTASVTASFYQSNDNVNYFPCKAGVAQTNYTKSYSLSANTWSEVDFLRDTVRISGRYLKVQFLTTATASVKGKLVARVKTNAW